MSRQWKIAASAAVLAVLAALVIGYAGSSMKTPVPGVPAAVNSSETMKSDAASKALIEAATPDTAADTALDDASIDTQAMQDEIDGEKAAIDASGEEINQLSDTYDENQL